MVLRGRVEVFTIHVGSGGSPHRNYSCLTHLVKVKPERFLLLNNQRCVAVLCPKPNRHGRKCLRLNAHPAAPCWSVVTLNLWALKETEPKTKDIPKLSLPSCCRVGVLGFLLVVLPYVDDRVKTSLTVLLLYCNVSTSTRQPSQRGQDNRPFRRGQDNRAREDGRDTKKPAYFDTLSIMLSLCLTPRLPGKSRKTKMRQ